MKKGADFLINITNDAWYHDTSSHYQHLSASVLRAVENGVCLVRAANTGVSGFITSYGKVYPLSDNNSPKHTFVSGNATGEVIVQSRANTLYTQMGDWFIIFCLIILIAGIWNRRRWKLDARY